MSLPLLAPQVSDSDERSPFGPEVDELLAAYAPNPARRLVYGDDWERELADLEAGTHLLQAR